MKSALIVALLAGHTAFAQLEHEPQARPSHRLRVGLRVDSPEKQVHDLFAKELGNLEQVELVFLDGNASQRSSEALDLELRVLVSDAHGVDESVTGPAPPHRYTISVKVTRPEDQENQPKAAERDADAASTAWLYLDGGPTEWSGFGGLDSGSGRKRPAEHLRLSRGQIQRRRGEGRAENGAVF